MSDDINEMEKMLNDYLEFAKSQSEEETSEINLSELINSLAKDFNPGKIKLDIRENIYFKARAGSLKRCFSNIIQNSLIYGEISHIKLYKTNNRVNIIFEDDGPGIPEEQHKNVFKPFYRLDKSRSLNKSGVGLGFAIVEDIVNSHGGNIRLSKSEIMRFNG